MFMWKQVDVWLCGCVAVTTSTRIQEGLLCLLHNKHLFIRAGKRIDLTAVCQGGLILYRLSPWFSRTPVTSPGPSLDRVHPSFSDIIPPCPLRDYSVCCRFRFSLPVPGPADALACRR